MVDTNSDPNMVNFPIPANDDASKSIALVIDKVCIAIKEGLEERKMEREKEASSKEKEDDSDKENNTAKTSPAKKSDDFQENKALSDVENKGKETGKEIKPED
ncbi:hypothetical protein ES705_44849 [subsurface metagenome]